jgi:uncharacterized membrane protein
MENCNAKHDFRTVSIVGLALIAFAVKLAIAYNTIGTNDTVLFYGFAKVLNEHSLHWTYAHSRYFNHPPLVAYFLRGIYVVTERSWGQGLGIHFPFLLRLPGIVADFLVVVVLLQFRRFAITIPRWALVLFAASPVSLMVSGFHGNTDPTMVLLLVCCVWMCLGNRPILSGLFFGLSCQIKIVPLLLLPAFAFYWLSHRKLIKFAVPLGLTTCILWAEPLLLFPVLFAKNVLAYGGYWGMWGVTYGLRATGLPEFNRVSFFDLEPAQTLVVTLLKMIIVGLAIWIGWRHRYARGHEFLKSIGYIWVVFFIFAPSVSPQYLVWLAPFILVLSASFYSFLLLSSSLFLFAFYNITSGGLPWSVALAMDESKQHWAAWALCPWLVLVIASIAIWRRRESVFALPWLRLHQANPKSV